MSVKVLEVMMERCLCVKELPSTNSRRKSWRLPIEVMTIVVDALADDQAQSTLASLQSTHSEMYKLVTPHLYRRMKFTTVGQAVEFFDLFGEVPLADQYQFLRPVQEEPGIHPINLPMHARLRWLLSHTTHLSFGIERFQGLRAVDSTSLGVYRDIHTAMRVARTRLWSSLQELRIDYSALTLNIEPASWEYSQSILDAQDLAEFHQLLFSSDPAPRDLLTYVSPSLGFRHGEEKRHSLCFHENVYEKEVPLDQGRALRRYTLPSAPRIIIENHMVPTYKLIPDTCIELEIRLARTPGWDWLDLLSLDFRWADSICDAATIRPWLSDTKPACIRLLKLSGLRNDEERWQDDEIRESMVKDIVDRLCDPMPKGGPLGQSAQLCIMREWGDPMPPVTWVPWKPKY